jgi:hypothetical protein
MRASTAAPIVAVAAALGIGALRRRRPQIKTEAAALMDGVRTALPP